MGQGARHAEDWHWLWNVYIVGGCLVGVAAVVLLNDRVPGNVALATATLTGIVLCTLTFGRRVIGAKEFTWEAIVFVAAVAGLFVLGLWAASATVAAIPAIYPLIFATLPLPAALAVSMAITLTPLLITVVQHGTDWPNLPVAIACTLVGVVAAPVIGTVIVTSVKQRARLATLVEELAASRAESARLSREAGAAAERERLAREIHDTLAQGFTSIVALAQAV